MFDIGADFTDNLNTENVKHEQSLLSERVVELHFIPCLLVCNQYTMLWSLLDYAAGTVPITQVTSDDLKHLPDYQITSNLTKRLREVDFFVYVTNI